MSKSILHLFAVVYPVVLALPLAAQNLPAGSGLVNVVEKGVLAAQQQATGKVTKFLRSTFRAQRNGVLTGGVSGTVFKTVYNGQEEIYGVVPAHALASKSSEKSLSNTFTASVQIGDEIVSIPATVVQVSAPSMLDLALVKFRPEDERLFEPLAIAQTPLEVGENLQSQGFALNRALYISERRLISQSPFTLRATIPGKQKTRIGLCGGAVLNDQNELVGIHLGSMAWTQTDLGYATPAKFLTNLVEAYHRGGEGFFPLEMDGEKLLDLRVDEYISDVVLLNDSGLKMFHLMFKNKFSYTSMQSRIITESPRYIDITVRRVHWGDLPGFAPLKERHEARVDRSAVTYRYDFKTKKVVEQRRDATLPKTVWHFLRGK